MSECTLPKPLYPAFPEWIPTTRTVGAQDQPQACLPGFLIQVFQHNVRLLFYKAISFVLDNSVSPKTFRNKTGNWLDWKRGFLVVVRPLEASSMTWKSSNEDITTGSNVQWVSIDMPPMKWSLVIWNFFNGQKVLPLPLILNCAVGYKRQ